MIISDFPNLTAGSFSITSPPSTEYNCIAWAADDAGNWWWPDLADSYWPEGVPREETLPAFVAAYATLGYSPCKDGSPEAGFEKIAIYSNADGPQHVARQLPGGRWTSKLGPHEDIEHDALERLNSDLYGEPVRFLKRPRP
jgi:hypothetical protein